MHFDDRLATVLRSRADGPVSSRIQFRQLLDLLGTLPADATGPQVDAAYDRLADLMRTIPAEDRTAIIRETGLRLRSPRLVAAIAQADPAHSASALANAQLAEEQWLDLIPALPIVARGHVRQRRDLGERVEELLVRLGIGDRALPPAEVNADTAAAPEAAANAGAAMHLSEAPAQPLDGIGALVRKIEAYRRSKQVIEGTVGGDSPRLPLGEEAAMARPVEARAFDFATDASGRIVWTDPGIAPMAIGLLLGSRSAESPASCGSEMVLTMRRLQPLRAARLRITGAPAITGVWQVEEVPEFDPLSGRFCGYRGRMRRPAIGSISALPASRDTEAERLRQALHELRTPVNAIQGFAEVIQQQLFGPTPHEYRALAANIVADSARILAGFDELERLAKLESGALETEPGETDIGAVIRATVAQLEPHTGPRESGFDIEAQDRPFTVGIAPGEVERLAWRLLATAATCAAPGERLAIRLGVDGGMVKLFLQLPATLAARNDDDLFYASATAATQALSAGMFGTGFTLRLARAEIRAAGGSMTREGGALLIDLPLVSGSGGTADRDTARR